MTTKVPYSDVINWGFPRPWGGGNADSRSVRLYYGSHSELIPLFPKLTLPDTAWVLLDTHVEPEDYDVDFLVGHEPWLCPVGFSTAPYSRKLAEVLKKSHVHRISKVQGFDADTLELIEQGAEVVSVGPVLGMYRHEHLGLGE